MCHPSVTDWHVAGSACPSWAHVEGAQLLPSAHPGPCGNPAGAPVQSPVCRSICVRLGNTGQRFAPRAGATGHAAGRAVEAGPRQRPGVSRRRPRRVGRQSWASAAACGRWQAGVCWAPSAPSPQRPAHSVCLRAGRPARIPETLTTFEARLKICRSLPSASKKRSPSFPSTG